MTQRADGHVSLVNSTVAADLLGGEKIVCGSQWACRGWQNFPGQG
jgi:hypothetical protein